MIPYVQHKQIDYARIQKYLTLSAQANTYTNNGPVKQLLESKLEQLFKLDPKVNRVVCTNSGTSALYVLISLFESLAKKPLRWMTPAFTFPAATVNKLQTLIVDIDPETYTLDLSHLDHCDGVIITTLFGTIPPNLLEIENTCKTKNKILILDNASSPLTTYLGRNINTFGDAAINSYHHTKYLGVGEAGAAIVKTEHYDQFKQLTNFGFTEERKFNNLASNSKMSDIAAAFILSHLETYDINHHISLQKRYVETISQIPGVKVFNTYCEDTLVRGNMALVFEKPTSHLAFRDVGIEANAYYRPLAPLPNSLALYERMINLPLHCGLTQYDLSLIFKKVETEAKK